MSLEFRLFHHEFLNNTTISPCCNTKYCFECISTWLHQKKQCPFCRATIDFNSLIIATDEPKQIKEEDALIELTGFDSTGKALVAQAGDLFIA